MSEQGTIAPTTGPAPAKEEAVDKRKTIYLNRLSMFAATNEAGKSPRLAWGLFDGNPRIEVRTNDVNDEKVNYGRITAPIDAFTCAVIADMLSTAGTQPSGWREKIVNKSTWHNGNKFNEPTRINDIIIGKDNEGTVYISVHEDNRPNIRFFFGPSQWHSLVKNDGSPYSRQELSVLYAKSYADMIRMIVATIIGYGSYVSTFTDHDGNTDQADKPTFSRGGGGGQWQNRNNGGGGNYNRGGGGGGGGYNRGGGGGGANWQNRGNIGGGGGNDYQQRNQQQASSVADEDIPL